MGNSGNLATATVGQPETTKIGPPATGGADWFPGPQSRCVTNRDSQAEGRGRASSCRSLRFPLTQQT